jgi:hypothetical protein
MEDDSQFGVSPDDVSGQSSDVGSYNQPNYMPQRRSVSYDPYSSVTGILSGVKRSPGSASAQNAARSSAIYSNDADFYVNTLGDVGAGAALLNSKKGTSVFEMLQPLEFSTGVDKDGNSINETYHVVPHGFSTVPTPKGPQRVSNYELAIARGVKSVPFKGGEERAAGFRKMMESAQPLLESLSKLEALYNKHTYLGNLDPSQDSALAKALEARIQADYAMVMNEAKASGSGTSDMDMTIIEAMTPHRASYTWSRLGGNEMALLKQVRQQVLNKINTVGQDNGIMLVPGRSSRNNSKQKENPYAKQIQ